LDWILLIAAAEFPRRAITGMMVHPSDVGRKAGASRVSAQTINLGADIFLAIRLGATSVASAMGRANYRLVSGPLASFQRVPRPWSDIPSCQQRHLGAV
jgi:hypothetical protein